MSSLDIDIHAFETGHENPRPAVHALCDAPESIRSMVHRIHARDDGQQDLRGADI